MTELLDRAIAPLRDLPDEDKDAFAEVLLSALQTDDVPTLDDTTRTAIRRGLAQARAGEFATDEEMAEL